MTTTPTPPTDLPSAVGTPARTDVTLETASEDVKALAVQRHAEIRAPAGAVFDMLRELEALDIHCQTLADEKSNTAGYFGCALFAGLFFPPVLVVVGPIALLGLLWYWWGASSYRKYDVPDDFRKLLLPVLDAIRNDVPRKGRIKLVLDLRGPTDEKELQRPDSGYDGWGIFWSYRRQYFEDRWGQLQVPLADGSMMVFDFWNEMLKRTRSRKNKVKWKKVSCARVTLLPPGEAMTLGAPSYSPSEFSGVAKLKGGERSRGDRAGYQLTAKAKFKQVAGIPAGTLSPERVLQMAFELYSMVQPRKRAG